MYADQQGLLDQVQTPLTIEERSAQIRVNQRRRSLEGLPDNGLARQGKMTTSTSVARMYADQHGLLDQVQTTLKIEEQSAQIRVNQRRRSLEGLPNNGPGRAR
jgi:hypothetical protein